jgi:hypothetical protein
MSAQKGNPAGCNGGVSRDLLCLGWSLHPSTVSDWRAQTLASRFCLSPWMARDLAALCYGEGCHD